MTHYYGDGCPEQPGPAEHCPYCGWVEQGHHIGTCPTAERDTLAAENERLREDVRRYGVHLDACNERLELAEWKALKEEAGEIHPMGRGSARRVSVAGCYICRPDDPKESQ